jgi:hypothetical protein
LREKFGWGSCGKFGKVWKNLKKFNEEKKQIWVFGEI